MQTSTVCSFKPQAEEINLFFHLLTACNLSCQHCYINETQNGRSKVSKADIEQWLKLFYRPGKKTNVVFLGGEPSLHPDLAFAVHTAKQLGYHSITIDTNGYLHHNLLEQLTPEDTNLNFSLDGPNAPVNDSLRGTGVFDICLANLKKAIACGFETGVIYTVSRKNIDYVAQMPALLAELGVKVFVMQVIGLRGHLSGAKSDDFQVDSEEWLAVVPKVAEQAAKLGLKAIYPKVHLEPEEAFFCSGKLERVFFLFPNGRIYLCPLGGDYPLHSYQIENGQVFDNKGITEKDLFKLDIAEGCVINKIVQPGNIRYDAEGKPLNAISCCVSKQQLSPSRSKETILVG